MDIEDRAKAEQALKKRDRDEGRVPTFMLDRTFFSFFILICSIQLNKTKEEEEESPHGPIFKRPRVRNIEDSNVEIAQSGEHLVVVKLIIIIISIQFQFKINSIFFKKRKQILKIWKEIHLENG